MSDSDLRLAEYSRDPEALLRALMHAPPEELVAMIEKNREQREWLKMFEELLWTAAPLCTCGAVATRGPWCTAHEGAEERYEVAERAYRKKPSPKTARELMRAAEVLQKRKEGVCQFPPCEEEVTTGYDGDYYQWCARHNEMFNDCVPVLPILRKDRGQPASVHRRELRQRWESEMEDERL